MTIRTADATLEQAPLVYDIMQKAFAEYIGVLVPPSGVHEETLEQAIASIQEGGAVLAWLSEPDGSETAVGSARYAFHNDSCYVGRVSVLPEYRGQGIASMMLNHIEPIARAHGSAYLEIGVRMVLESNIRLYERHGYHIDSVFEHPKGGGMVATMVKPLK
jgi:ribosomal protein S18 acetylase RimI-like enzyme